MASARATMGNEARRADDLLARAWRRASGRTVSGEGFLEDALAAALEHPAVWPCLARHLGWATHDLPLSPPSVTTQRTGNFVGRTDIELDWPSPTAPTLILELKRHAPPDIDQVRTYLDRDGVLLAAVAGWSDNGALRKKLLKGQAERFLGVVTWAQLRDLACAETPMELRQLQRLIDAMGVAMPRLNAAQIAAAVGSLSVWTAWDSWIPAGLSAVRPLLSKAGISSSPPRGPRLDGGWYAGWFDLPFAAGDRAQLWVGLILNDDNYAAIEAGLPDLAVHLEIDTRLPSSRALRADEDLTVKLRKWAAVKASGEERMSLPGEGEWPLLSTRVSSAILLTAADQRQAFTDWARGAVEAWEQHGILTRIAELTRDAAETSQQL